MITWMKLFQSVYLQVCKELEMQQALLSTVNVLFFILVMLTVCHDYP